MSFLLLWGTWRVTQRQVSPGTYLTLPDTCQRFERQKKAAALLLLLLFTTLIKAVTSINPSACHLLAPQPQSKKILCVLPVRVNKCQPDRGLIQKSQA